MKYVFQDVGTTLKGCGNDTSEAFKVLKGDEAYLKALLSRGIEVESNSGKSTPPNTTNSFTQLVFTLPLLNEDLNVYQIEKEPLYFGNVDLTQVYLQVPSPPPKSIL
jgi:hypothetical protein